MKSNRRQFIKAGILSSTAIATGIPQFARAHDDRADTTALNILILGGTGFIGPHMVREALRRGHKVTLFNRGKTNNTLFPDLETIKGDRDNGLDGLKGCSWDAVIDNSGYVPRHVQDSTRMLAPNSHRYLYISTVSVYADFNVDNDESSPLATLEDESIEQVTGATYGPLKALCETRARAEVDDHKLTIIRPTYIAGPGDHTDRLSYWPIRTRGGGEMIWPGSANDFIQVVDVRDLAVFTIDCLVKELSGVFNAVNPAQSYSMGDLLSDSQAVSAATVDPLWIGEDFAYENDLIGGRLLPIWNPKGGAEGANVSFIGDVAVQAGFHNRPERETIRDLLVWWDAQSDERRENLKAGLSADREAALIVAWKKQQQ